MRGKSRCFTPGPRETRWEVWRRRERASELHQLHRKYVGPRIADRVSRATLVASLAREGQQMPVVVVRADRAERYVLIDGYQRVGALEALGRDVVDAVLLAMADVALAMNHRLKRRRESSALEEGWLLDALIVEHGHTQTSLPTLLGRDKSWVRRVTFGER